MARDECVIRVLRHLCIAPILSSVPLGVTIPQLLCALRPIKAGWAGRPPFFTIYCFQVYTLRCLCLIP